MIDNQLSSWGAISLEGIAWAKGKAGAAAVREAIAPCPRYDLCLYPDATHYGAGMAQWGEVAKLRGNRGKPSPN